LVEGLNAQTVPGNIDVVVSPMNIHIPYVLANLKDAFNVAAQTCSKTGNGAFTGEVSAEALVDSKVSWVIIGHSERRQLFGETNDDVATKISSALAAGLSVMACLGETLAERKANKTSEVVTKQLASIIQGVPENAWNRVVIAYEPIWAIGTGVVATPQQAQDIHKILRTALRNSVGLEVAHVTRIIYGGSVKPANSTTLINQPDIDGFLVGGASLKADSFGTILTNAGRQVTSSL
jgi:triosephosphate isomerase